MRVRRGEAADAAAAAETLAAAFAGHAWTNWTVAADDQQERLRQSFELILERAILPFAELWVADDCASAAVWLPPGSDSGVWPAFDEIAGDLRELAGDRADRGETAEAETSRLRLREPHWFLVAMGTRPDRQRQGLGTALLRPVLEQADVAQLETSSHENLEFYATLGFEVVDELRISGGGPHVWSMVRRRARRAATL